MKKKYEPIKINILDSKRKEIDYQLIYYNNSKVLDLIIIAPYFVLTLTFLILISIYLISYYSNKSEKDRLWTGLAKETAHQLGTPLSSLIGWNEYLKSKNKVDKKYISGEIDKDLNRLKTITDRFSTIGSKPSLNDKGIKKSIIESIGYLKKRVSPDLETKLNLEEVNYNFNKQLFGWVIENLYKNSVDAIGKNGTIEIKLYQNKYLVIIEFIDDGIGINKSNFSKIFTPGFTTKKRGWGLGLTLVYRIITDYHKGKIFVKNSIKNIKTTIRIELKK
jgi:signal transduction histidine kinase